MAFKLMQTWAALLSRVFSSQLDWYGKIVYSKRPYALRDESLSFRLKRRHAEQFNFQLSATLRVDGGAFICATGIEKYLISDYLLHKNVCERQFSSATAEVLQ